MAESSSNRIGFGITVAGLSALIGYTTFKVFESRKAKNEKLLPNKQVRVGVSTIILDSFSQSFLLGQRKGSHGAGQYCNPGGHLEMNESINVCASRELYEETSIFIPPSKFTFFCITNDIMPNNKHYITIHMKAEWNGSEPRTMEPDKCNGWSFINIQTLKAMHSKGLLFPPVHNMIQNGFLPRLFNQVQLQVQPQVSLPSQVNDMIQLHGSESDYPNLSLNHRVIFLSGYPGSGKGTQGSILSKKYKILHVSTGELFRAEASTGSEIGQKMNYYIQRGEIIPPEYTFAYLRTEFAKPKYKNGFLLDGYPKDSECFSFIMDLLPSLGFIPTAAFYFHVSREALEARLLNRIYCPVCQTNYHTITKSLQPRIVGQCDNNCIDSSTGKLVKLIPREDDNLKTIKKRLDVFDNSTRANLTSFKRHNLLYEIDASLPPDQVTTQITRGLYHALSSSPKYSYYLFPLKEKEKSTKWHNHMDCESRSILESLVRAVHQRVPSAQNKIYPVSDLMLCKQVYSDKFKHIYERLPNFHYISNAQEEAFTTGKMGDTLDYEHLKATLDILSHKNSNDNNSNDVTHNTNEYNLNSVAMSEIEEDLFEAEWDSSHDNNNYEAFHITRNDGDSVNNIDWNIVGSEWRDRLISQDLPKYELHHAIDITRTYTEQNQDNKDNSNINTNQEWEQKPIELLSLNEKWSNDPLFDIGGLFMFKKKGVWAYRTSEFANCSYQECIERLKAQSISLRKLFKQILPAGTHFTLACSLEKVHAIWAFGPKQ